MGKSEQNPHRFRRKAKSSASLSAGRETTSDPVVSAPNEVGDLLCDSPAQSPSRKQGSGGVANGRCSHSELANGDPAGGERRLSGEDDLDDEDGPTSGPESFGPASSLPVDLAGLPRSDVTPLGSDDSFDLSACHVHGDDSLALVIFVHNLSSSDVQQVRLELHSDELQVIIIFFFKMKFQCPLCRIGFDLGFKIGRENLTHWTFELS